MAERAYLGLGSNLGDRLAYLQTAVQQLSATPGVRLEAASSVWETAPVGVTDQPWFLNAVVALLTELEPEELLAVMQRLEADHHRRRDQHWGPRTLDLDLLLFGQRRLATTSLTVPHPRLTERAFALAPLCELAPDLVHPVSGRRLADHLAELGGNQPLLRLGALALPGTSPSSPTSRIEPR
jgi:2-amino-4-hydroxy-6-hydroxymethyldihydropteridine diphosphokinase